MVYDVFLSFRGTDTRNKFTAHLYNALLQQEIDTYMDDHIRIGEKISKALIKAIENSRIAIVILSKNYAESSWCLNELIQILECKEKKQQMVVPIFYDVEPSEVRKQTGSVGEAFAKLKVKVKDDGKLETWKTALKKVSKLSGHHLRNRNESKFIQIIIQDLQRSLPKVVKDQCSAGRICAGCNTEMGRGKHSPRRGIQNVSDVKHAIERLLGISTNEQNFSTPSSESGNHPCNVSCHKAQCHPRSDVCKDCGGPHATRSLHSNKRSLIVSIFN